MSILKEIYEYKKNFVEQQKNKCSQKKIENQLIIDKNKYAPGKKFSGMDAQTSSPVSLFTRHT